MSIQLENHEHSQIIRIWVQYPVNTRLFKLSHLIPTKAGPYKITASEIIPISSCADMLWVHNRYWSGWIHAVINSHWVSAYEYLCNQSVCRFPASVREGSHNNIITKKTHNVFMFVLTYYLQVLSFCFHKYWITF